MWLQRLARSLLLLYFLSVLLWPSSLTTRILRECASGFLSYVLEACFDVKVRICKTPVSNIATAYTDTDSSAEALNFAPFLHNMQSSMWWRLHKLAMVGAGVWFPTEVAFLCLSLCYFRSSLLSHLLLPFCLNATEQAELRQLLHLV